MDCRPHPLYILYDAKKWLPLLLIPLLRAVFSNGDTVAVLLSSLRDVALALLLLGFYTLKWSKARYRIDAGLTTRQGLVLIRRTHVAAGEAASVELVRTPLLALCRGRRVHVNTAGLRRRADTTLFLSKSAAQQIASLRSRRRGCIFRARVWPTVVMAASNSNAALGLLTLAPALRQSGRILGEQLPDRVYGLVGRVVSLGLPPLLESLANILVLGWCFSFLRGLLRYGGFYAHREGEQLHLIAGLLTRRDVLIDVRRITLLEFRQTLLMQLTGLHTAVITAAGYGREKGARPVVVPAARKRELCAALDQLIPGYPTCPGGLKPRRTALARYLLPPLLTALVGLYPLYLGGVWTMAGLLWLAGTLWWGAVRLIGCQRAVFGVADGCVLLRYSRGLALHEIHVPAEVADCVVLKRSPWQCRSGTCTVELRCYGEKRRRHRVYALPYDPARQLVEKLRTQRAGT